MSNKTIFTKRIRFNQESILNAKKKNFFKRSLWKYLFSVIIITLVSPDLFGSPLKTFVGLFLTIISISILVMFVSAKVMANKLALDAEIEFNENNFLIKSINSEKKEQLINWKSVNKLIEMKNTFVIDLDKTPPHLISIKKEGLEEKEMNYFRNRIKKA